jgi:hypothetical protein
LVIHLSPVNDRQINQDQRPSPQRNSKVSGIFSVISVSSSERSERVVKRIFGFSPATLLDWSQVNNQKTFFLCRPVPPNLVSQSTG